MVSRTLGRTVGHGAVAGAAAGGVGATALYWLVEPSIRAAIAIEEAGGPAGEAGGHSHAAGGDHAGSHGLAADALVPRDEQVVFALVTVLLVGILIGIAFALAHRVLGTRLPGKSPAGSAMTLAGLGFVAFTLAPAIIVPANPPAVGDPATVSLRAVTYLGTIVCAVALTTIVTALARAKELAPRSRAVAATALGIVGSLVLVWALPNAADPVPANVPADLVWEFRVGSLTQLGLMWLVLGAVFAYLTPSQVVTRTSPPTPMRIGRRRHLQPASVAEV
ncbi:CbtA family protein [Streptomyces albicerus]|uniref:CbtA family protein n=1 Tax=Streptomyces albicerus TaxID=2569859 RepID=UPI00124BC310|nr:CbtA family protein [Streptomyces albicerus]